MSDVSISATVNTTIEGLQITSGTYTFENVNTSAKTDVSYPTSLIQLADGLYNVTFIGKGTYSQNGTSVEVNVQGVQQNVTVSGGSCKLDLTAHVVNTGDADFVIAEIFLPGTYNEAGKQYNGDQYVRIYNNSDTVLYADGLVFMESHHHHTEISVGRPGYHERSDCGRFCGRSTGQRNRLSDTTGESLLLSAITPSTTKRLTRTPST